MKVKYLAILIAFVFGFIWVLPKIQAVSPPPDGGYPGGNTAEGATALLSLTTGGFNTALGFFSLRSDTTGSFNTAIGAGTLLANTGDDNTATGAGALLSNTTGTENAATGTFSLFSNTTGSFNTATGSQVLIANTTGTENTANGAFALGANTDGSFNTAVGAFSLANNTGSENTAVGVDVLFNNTAGGNTGIGTHALRQNTTGFQNTALGDSALTTNAEGSFKTAIGASALTVNTGDGNTACGNVALFFNTGSNNTALANGAGTNLTFGDNNIDIGYIVGGVAGESNTIRIGNSDITNTFISGISGTNSPGGVAVFCNSDGKLGVISSSARFKEDINQWAKRAKLFSRLNRSAFVIRRRSIPRVSRKFGLIAEEVEKVNPDLIIRDREGKPQTFAMSRSMQCYSTSFLKRTAKWKSSKNRLMPSPYSSKSRRRKSRK